MTVGVAALVSAATAALGAAGAAGLLAIVHSREGAGFSAAPATAREGTLGVEDAVALAVAVALACCFTTSAWATIISSADFGADFSAVTTRALSCTGVAGALSALATMTGARGAGISFFGASVGLVRDASVLR